MANIKVSEMTQANSVNDIDLLMIVQGTENKKVTKQKLLEDVNTSKQDKLTAGANIQIQNNVISATDTTYNNATTSQAGLMSASDKSKLNGIEAQANKTTVDSALNSTSTNPVQNKVICQSQQEQDALITALQTENDNLRKALPNITGTGTNITLNNTSDNKFNELVVEGNTEQEQLSGKNKINYETVEPTSNTTIQLINNGFKVTGKYAGKVIIENLKANTNYHLQYTIQNIVGNTNKVVVFAGTGTTTTIKSMTAPGMFNTGENTTINIWFYASNGGSDGEANFTFIQLEEGSTATDYEKFVGGIPSPNPDFPQQIKNVTGNVNVKIQNKNLFDKDNVNLIDNVYVDGTGKILSGNNNKFCWLKLQPNTTYTLTQPIVSKINNRVGLYSEIPALNLQGTLLKTFMGGSPINCTFTTSNTDVYIGWVYCQTNFMEGHTEQEMLDSIQLEQGTTATSYVPHQEQNLPFTFAEGQRAMQGTQLLDDGIHQKRARDVLDGTESLIEQVLTTNTASYLISLGSNVKLSNTSPLGYLSNYFKAYSGSSWSADIPRLVQMNDKRFRFGINKDELSEISANGFKTWLATKYKNGTPVIVEYELEEEEIIPYNATQQTQYNAIKEAMSYYEQTNISSTSNEISAIIEANAVGDLNLIIS